MAKEALSNPAVAQHYHGNHKDHHTQGTGSPLQQKGQQIEEYHQHLVLKHDGTG